MKIDIARIEYDVKKGWHAQTQQPTYAVRAEHPDFRHTIGHGTGATEDTARTAARKNLMTQLAQSAAER